MSDVLTTDALGVWHELELALVGKNGFGGDVAEIYAYRLIPGGASKAMDSAVDGQRAGKNMTELLRRFVDLHGAVVISIEEREGFRPIAVLREEFPPFDWRVHLRVEQRAPHAEAPSTRDLRDALEHVAEHAGSLVAMIDELEARRSKDRLGAESREPAATEDLPPDAPTGLYLDRPFDVDDLEWLKMAWDAYFSRADGGPPRPSQIMLVFQTIRRDERATQEFLRVMNTILLPLCRRLRLKEQPHLRDLGAASE